MIEMFSLEFLNNLRQPPTNNPWLTNLMNWTYRMWFQQQCDYMLGFQANFRLNKSLLVKNGQGMSLTLKIMHMKHQHLPTTKVWIN
jgi:hypothetical protein